MLGGVRQQGLTLIELSIGIVIIAMALAVGVPSFTVWIQNTQVRTGAESILNGLQLARTEAVRRNTPVRFSLTDLNGTVAWSVDCVPTTSTCSATIQSHGAGDGSSNARVGVSSSASAPTTQLNTAITAGTGLPAGVTFDSLGRVVTANIGTDITRIDVTNTALPTARRMVIVVGSGGDARMCDPTLSLSSNPQGCV